MKKMAILVLFIIGTGAVLGLFARISRANELRSLSARLPGANIIADKQIVSAPPLFATSAMRTWTFKIDADQVRSLKALCAKNAGAFPVSSLQDRNGCVVSYDLDNGQSRYSTLTVKSGTAVIASVGMAQSDLNTLSETVGNKGGL